MPLRTGDKAYFTKLKQEFNDAQKGLAVDKINLEVSGRLSVICDEINLDKEIQAKGLKSNVQTLLAGYIKLLINSTVDPGLKRDLMQKIAYTFPSAKYSDLRGALSTGEDRLDAASWCAAQAQIQILSNNFTTPVNDACVKKPIKRIIAFNIKDITNPEVMASLDIAFKKHAEEGCLVCCSEEDIKYFGEDCEVLVLIGHGHFSRLGDKDDKGRLMSQDDVGRSRVSESFYIGPYAGFAVNVGASIAKLLADGKLANVNHCRLVACRSGALEDKLIENQEVISSKIYVKPGEPGQKSAAVICESKEDVVFCGASIAGTIWSTLFYPKNGKPLFDIKEKDFALSGSVEMINPVTQGVPEPRFEGTSKSDRWNRGKEQGLPSFWDKKIPAAFQVKSIMMATPLSTKAKNKIEGYSDEHGEYHPPKYKS